MKWLFRGFLVLVLLVAAAVGLAVGTALRTGQPVGFQVVRVESGGTPMAVALWYPTTARAWPTTFVGGTLLSVAADGPVREGRWPVVVLSHGNGGSATSHADLAMALADAGYIVAAPTHPGDNFADASRQGAPTLFSDRAAQLRATLDYLSREWSGREHVDTDRAGLFGMSAGAFTALTLAGGRPDLALIPAHCAQAPEFICEALAQVGSPLRTGADGGPFAADPRFRAAVVAAPGLGFTLAGDGLADVQVPVQVWSGDADDTVPYASNAGLVVAGLGPRAEAHRLAGASHVSFLAPCGLLKPPAFCTDPAGFDRRAAHQAMNAEIIRFYGRHLVTTAH